MTPRVTAMMEMRRTTVATDWVFPASTRGGHIEKSSLRKQHLKACRLAEVAVFPLYTFRHTCLTRWAAHMDPYTLAYLAGHSDFSTTRRYVHPQAHTVREAMERARKVSGGHTFGHTGERLPERQDFRDSQNVPQQSRKLREDWSGRVDSNHRPPGPETEGPRHLLDYRANILAKNFILSTKSTLVGGQLGGLFIPSSDVRPYRICPPDLTDREYAITPF